MHMIDWYPTLLKLTGAPRRSKASSRRPRHLANHRRKQEIPARGILLNSRPGSGAIRVGNWKLAINGSVSEIRQQQPGKTENDKTELFNLAMTLAKSKKRRRSEPGKTQGTPSTI